MNTLVEALKPVPSRVWKIFILKDAKNKKIAEIIQLAKARHVPFLFVPKDKLERLDRGHQGVVAYVSPKEFFSPEEILSSSGIPLLVLLDGIEDPQNLGAIIRIAEGAGVDGIILPERRSAGLTETVASISAGALEYVKVARVKNLARTMDDLRRRDIWMVGAEGARRSLGMNSITAFLLVWSSGLKEKGCALLSKKNVIKSFLSLFLGR